MGEDKDLNGRRSSSTTAGVDEPHPNHQYLELPLLIRSTTVAAREEEDEGSPFKSHGPFEIFHGVTDIAPPATYSSPPGNTVGKRAVGSHCSSGTIVTHSSLASCQMPLRHDSICTYYIHGYLSHLSHLYSGQLRRRTRKGIGSCSPHERLSMGYEQKERGKILCVIDCCLFCNQ